MASWATRGAAILAAGVTFFALSGCVISGAQAPSSESSTATAPAPLDTATPDRVAPVVVVAGLDVDGENVTVSGYVAGIVESGGVCNFVLTGPRSDRTVSGAGYADSSSTSCGALQVKRTDLSGGKWNVVLQYTAVDGTVSSSAPRAMELP
jgi:hypothetical protein